MEAKIRLIPGMPVAKCMHCVVVDGEAMHSRRELFIAVSGLETIGVITPVSEL